MKSVDFTVQRLIGTASDSNPRLQYRSRSPTDSKHEHVTSDDVTTDEERSTGARNDEHDDSPSRPRDEAGRLEPLLIPPSIYLDYARQFLWQLTGAYRPGLSIYPFSPRFVLHCIYFVLAYYFTFAMIYQKYGIEH